MRGKKARAIRKEHNIKHVRLARLRKPNFDHLPVQTFWNFEKCNARKVTAKVADSEAPLYWAREFIGQRRKAVEIEYNGNTFYLDDEDGQGWRKVTEGRGSPWYGHKSLSVETISVKERE